VGLIHPRVRVITEDRHFFSGDASLIIHDKIIKADLKTIEGARSLDIVEVDNPADSQVDGYENVYILRKRGNKNIVKRYLIQANTTVLSDNDPNNYINLTQFGINYPRSIKADRNNNLYVAALLAGG
jgi:hypothetical protein